MEPAFLMQQMEWRESIEDARAAKNLSALEALSGEITADKRSRFAPSTHSLLAVLPLKWLLAPVAEYDQTPRWRAAGLFRVQPVTDAILPVREMRVLYGLKQHDYQGFVRSSPPHAHEFFIPMDMLIEEDNELNPRLRALVKRSSVASNFMNA